MQETGLLGGQVSFHNGKKLHATPLGATGPSLGSSIQAMELTTVTTTVPLPTPSDYINVALLDTTTFHTISVQIQDVLGEIVTVTAIVDSGATANFIHEDVLKGANHEPIH